ncbi:CAP domain-containing protein [Streptomyces sp. NPDC001732]
MGRHSRSAAAPGTENHAAGGTGAARPRGHRRKPSASPVRTGLVGVSAALAVGAVAMSSGLLPGGGTYTIGGGPSEHVRPEGDSDLLTQGGSSIAPADRGTSSAQSGRGIGRADGLAKAESSTPSAFPSKTPRTSRTSDGAKPSRSATAAGSEASRSSAPAAGKSSAAPKTSASASVPTARRSVTSAPASSSAQAAVLALVNQERAKVGCSPLTARASLASLAQDFSEDMASRGFFDHTDPDGRSPWGRASKAGVKGLAAENIARGQADAQAVMEAWMNSAGHRANILNCDYKTLGVGVHQGSGGPWWTQEFGF